jgi:hypothetical protein
MINRTQTPQPPLRIVNHQENEEKNSMMARYSLFKVGYIEDYLLSAGTGMKRVSTIVNL